MLGIMQLVTASELFELFPGRCIRTFIFKHCANHHQRGCLEADCALSLLQFHPIPLYLPLSLSRTLIMSHKNPRASSSKSSAAATPTMSLGTTKPPKSSISKSSFAPSYLQLNLFASVIQGFDSQQLRIHDTRSGRQRCQHAAGPGTRITSLDWGYYRSTHLNKHHKRENGKRKREGTRAEGAVVAYGTSDSEIYMYSPAEAGVVGKLTGGHERGIKDFRFSPEDASEGWSAGGDGKLVQWDLNKTQAKRFVSAAICQRHACLSNNCQDHKPK